MRRIMGLRMVNFVYKDDELARVRFGIIAEEAEDVAPQYVKHNQFPVPAVRFTMKKASLSTSSMQTVRL
ncbi:tail fiber domain-containing protein [Salmonella enterica subsp. enterica serovar Senftenberg]|nr:tail fiber domain-containing protein [Salmonella enterica subsp. enterica serovar Senftenberg]